MKLDGLICESDKVLCRHSGGQRNLFHTHPNSYVNVNNIENREGSIHYYEL